MSPRTFVIVNPRSRSGRTGERLAELRALLQKHLGSYELALTTAPGDGARLAREAEARGASTLVVAGGDGTVSEALHGLLERTNESPVRLGLLPLGTGRDFARHLGLGDDLGTSVERLAHGRTRLVDAGRIRARAPGGGERTRCFLNIASLGLSYESALWLEARSQRDKKRGPLSYVASGLVGFTRYRAPEVTVRVDGQPVFSAPLLLAAIANGQYFGGGMQVAPDARSDDGAFDVVLVPTRGAARSLAALSRLALGSHVRRCHAHVARGRVVEASSLGPVGIEADGEPIGLLPAHVELLPGAVTLCGLP